MPKLPLDDNAAMDISHSYWQEWLRGGVDQLSEFRRVLGDYDRYPDRSSFQSEDEWNAFFGSIVDSISTTMEFFINRIVIQRNDYAFAFYYTNLSG